MSKGKSSTEMVPVEPVAQYTEQTMREMEAGREAARRNAAAQERAETSRALEATTIAAALAEEQRLQAEEKLRVVAEAEAAHAAKTSAQPESSL